MKCTCVCLCSRHSSIHVCVSEPLYTAVVNGPYVTNEYTPDVIASSYVIIQLRLGARRPLL